jgi:hypothetical protein
MGVRAVEPEICGLCDKPLAGPSPDCVDDLSHPRPAAPEGGEGAAYYDAPYDPDETWNELEDRYRATYARLHEALRRIAELREALEEEWEANHVEHCSREWPHPEGYRCCWPKPAALFDTEGEG